MKKTFEIEYSDDLSEASMEDEIITCLRTEAQFDEGIITNVKEVEGKMEIPLTKREHYAFEIFKKLIDESTEYPSRTFISGTQGQRSANYADELIKALSKEDQ